MENDKMMYELGSNEQGKWKDKYFFAPRGIGFSEPGTIALDDARLSAYNVAKSSYQIHPDVFNLEYVAQNIGVSAEDVKKRMIRMYDEHLMVFVMNPATQVYGWGLYYWLVKLRDDATEEEKKKLSDWYQNKDDICTGYECKGDFDFFNGNHMRVLDNLLYDVIEPWKNSRAVEYVHICPVRRDIRESNVNMWDCGNKEDYRKCLWGEGQLEKLSQIQDKLDIIDLKIINSLNNTPRVEDMFNFEKLSEISGLDPDDMCVGIKEAVETKRIIVPMFYINFMKLNLTMHYYMVRLFQTIPCHRKAEIIDELTKNPEFNNVIEFADANYDVLLGAFNELSDVAALKKEIEKYGEVEEIKEADVYRQFRRWVCRLDDQNGFWEECVFTDDFLQDRSVKRSRNDCPLCKSEEA